MSFSSKPFLTDRKRLLKTLKSAPLQTQTSIGMYCDIGWGHPIRSYVLDQSRIKDLRTNIEIGNAQGVLDDDPQSINFLALQRLINNLG